MMATLKLDFAQQQCSCMHLLVRLMHSPAAACCAPSPLGSLRLKRMLAYRTVSSCKEDSWPCLTQSCRQRGSLRQQPLVNSPLLDAEMGSRLTQTLAAIQSLHTNATPRTKAPPCLCCCSQPASQPASPPNPKKLLQGISASIIALSTSCSCICCCCASQHCTWSLPVDCG